ncbi:Dephospho-CoA kinase [Nosema granulosis]|uniref:Dephospho-CoA kinase n=1 Tax=Nosema granulosis TaxID=83296 RepID=A0A9P6GYI9_9MICR|nr:Dephospho-CoA kinase [Nosema granulosis]
MKIIIVTGGLKTGKSTFIRRLKEHGFFTISCDQIVKGILSTIKLDKEFVLSHFFTNRLFRNVYLAFIIPTMLIVLLIKCFIGTLLGHSLIFIEVPLLYEYHFDKFFFNVVIYASRDEQLKRIESTGVSVRFLEMQLPIEYKKERADHVVNNNGDPKELDRVVRSIRNNSMNIYQILIIVAFCCFM